MKRTNIYATPEERQELQQLIRSASMTPKFGLSSAQVLSGRDFASRAWERARDRCHVLALAHGLPEIPGRYGITPEGEFCLEEP